MKKIILKMLLFCVLMAGIFAGCGNTKQKTENEDRKQKEQAEAGEQEEAEKGTMAEQMGIQPEDLVILFTTDIHSKETDYIGYDGLAAYKKEVEAICGKERVILVDGGDTLNGSALGENTSGAAITEIMDEVGYVVATPGNNDFKFRVSNLQKLAQERKFCYLSCNLREISTGENVLEPYVILERADKRIAFIGVTTPKGTHTSAEFQDFAVEDEEGETADNPTYDFSEEQFYERVQSVIDQVREQQVDYVILLTHLGYDGREYSSGELIQRTTGVDAVLDGHAHKAIEMEKSANAEGKEVLLSSAGQYLENIGQLVIAPDGTMEAKLLHVRNYREKDEAITKYIKDLEEMHQIE